MIEKLVGIETRYEELGKLLEQSVDDYQKVAELAKERSDIEPIYLKAQEYRDIEKKLTEAKALSESDDYELRELATAEINELTPRIEQVENDIKTMLVPKDPRDQRNVIVEIRAGAGGDEAALFAADLYRMYTRYAERQGWKYEVLSASEIGLGGYKEIIFQIKGKNAFSRLKYESGVHRVQRVPATEAQGRIHTSTATVVVLAEVDDIDIEIPDSDIKVDVFRSAGAGGQNVQKNCTAVRITHVPSGIVIACQDERSQLQNRLRAMSILKARLYELEEQKRQSELEETRHSQAGSGDRSEKIRTYNYPQSRITDHRINLSVFNLAGVMDGDIDKFIDELSLQSETERLSAPQENEEE